MTDEFERKLEIYADVIVKVGLNLQPGQRLMIGAPIMGIEGAPIEAYPLVAAGYAANRTEAIRRSIAETAKWTLP